MVVLFTPSKSNKSIASKLLERRIAFRLSYDTSTCVGINHEHLRMISALKKGRNIQRSTNLKLKLESSSEILIQKIFFNVGNI